MFKIAVLISGGGTNLQSIIDGIENGYLKDCSIEVVISDREGAYGLVRAQEHNINNYVLDRKQYKHGLSDAILNIIKDKVDLIVLAGYLSILDGKILEEYRHKIINIHPSLIPSFCGGGMYGLKVHEAAINYGVKLSGCTVHFVDGGTDTGAIIVQRSVPVYAEDSPEMLQKRILPEEHKCLTEAIKYISQGRVKVEGRRVSIAED